MFVDSTSSGPNYKRIYITVLTDDFFNIVINCPLKACWLERADMVALMTTNVAGDFVDARD